MQKLTQVLKHWFTAHPGNDHRPGVLRSRSLGVILALVVITEGLVFIQSAPVASRFPLLGEILSSVLITDTNGYRAQASLGTLRENAVLDAAALAKARDMASKSYFAHTSPEGLTPWHWFDVFGYHYTYAGENLAVNFTDSKEVTDAWMNSPGHRANILNGQFQEIGIGMARGTFEGKEAVFVVQLFATPSKASGQAPAGASAPIGTGSTPKPVALAPKPSAPKPAAPQPVAPKEQPLFVAVEGATSAPSANSGQGEATSSSSSAPVAATSDPLTPVIRGGAATTAILGRPKSLANAFALFFTLLLGLVLLGKIVRVGLVHPRLVASALFVFAVSAGAFVLNHYQFVAQAKVF